MTFDGLPSRDNPHFSEPRQEQSDKLHLGQRLSKSVRSAGGRRPTVCCGQWIISDRFLEIEIDGNYLWEGSASSFMAVSDLLIPVSRGLGQFDYYHSGLGFFPDEFNNRFFLVQSGSPVEDERPVILTSNTDSTNIAC